MISNIVLKHGLAISFLPKEFWVDVGVPRRLGSVLMDGPCVWLC